MQTYNSSEWISVIEREFLEPARKQHVSEVALRLSDVQEKLGAYGLARKLAGFLQSEEFQLKTGTRLLRLPEEMARVNSRYRYELIYTLQDA